MNGIAVPAIDRAIVQRRDELVAMLHGLVPLGRVVHTEQERGIYASDAFAGFHALPMAVVLPANVREVTQVLRYCCETGIKVFPRGGGTSLTGGATGAMDGIVLCLSRMSRVLEIDVMNCLVRVEAGITNAAVSDAVAGNGLFFPPDPGSRSASTIGGNIATDASGPRAMRYGTTGRHVLALKLVLCDGEVIELGGGELESSGFDLVGMLVGSEGLFGVVVEATLRVVPRPEARRLVLLGFPGVSAAVACASAMRSAGISLCAAEVIDRQVVAVCEQFAGAGLPRNVEALAVFEIEGPPDYLEEPAAMILRASNAYGPTEVLDIADVERIDRVWMALDASFTALGTLGAVRCVDVTVPSGRLAEAMATLGDIAARHGLRGANLCRAQELPEVLPQEITRV